MGFRFRKSIKILPGLKINVTQKGISSASIGKAGASINIGKKGTRTTVGLPGSGLSYSKYKAYDAKEQPSVPLESSQNNASSGKIGRGIILLIVIIAFILGAIIF